MNEPLRPSTLGEILDRTAQLYRRNFWLFAGTAAIPMGTLVLIGAAAGVSIVVLSPGLKQGNPAASVTLGLVAIVGGLVALPAYLAAIVYSSAGLTYAAVSTHRGEKLTIRDAFRSVTPRFWTYLGCLFLQALVVGLVPASVAAAVIVPLVYLITRSGVGVGASVALGFVIFLVAAAAVGVIIWLTLSYVMGMAVCVTEKTPAWESMKRAMHLSAGTRGRIFVMFLLVFVLSMIASTLSYFVLMIGIAIGAALGGGPRVAAVAALAGAILQAIVSLVADTILAPVSWIGLVLFYYDQRIRKEGFDIEWMMEQAGMTQPQPVLQPSTGEIISAPVIPPDTVEER